MLAKQKLSRHEIAEITGECISVVDDAIKAGDLDTFLVGRRRFARPAAVTQWVDFLEKESKAGRPVQYRARAARQQDSAVAMQASIEGDATRGGIADFEIPPTQTARSVAEPHRGAARRARQTRGVA